MEIKNLFKKLCKLGIHYLEPLAFLGTHTEYYCKWCDEKFTKYKKEYKK